MLRERVGKTNGKTKTCRWQASGSEVDASFDLCTSYAIREKVLGKGDVGHLLWADFGLPIYGHTYVAPEVRHRETIGGMERTLAVIRRNRQLRADLEFWLS